MRKNIITLILCFYLSSLIANATILYPGRTTNISFEPTTGEYGPTWTTSNPTIQLSSTGFTCSITAKAYFSGTATVTCTYKDRIGNSVYERKRSWDYTCIDTHISISPTSKSLKLNESFQFTYSFNRTTYLTPSIQFIGYDMEIVNITSNGLVTAKSVGETKIYVKSNIGTNSVICTVKVSDSNSNDISSISNSNYYDWDSSKTMIVTLDEAGTLCDYITDNNKYTITDLTIIGPLNGSDLRLLRDMAGINFNNSNTKGKLETLDLKESIFISGGSWYVDVWGEYYYTSDTFSPYYAFTWCNKLKKIRLPKYYSTIPAGTTQQCYRLEKLSIPPGVTTIYKYNLSGGWNEATSQSIPLTMQTLSLPSTVNLIYFNNACDNLTDIYCYATVPPKLESSGSFSNLTNCSNGTLYVPKGSAQAYWKADGWREFKNIKETLEIYNAIKFCVGEYGSVIFNNEIIEKKYNDYRTRYQVFDIPTTQDVIISIVPNDGYLVSLISVENETIDIPENTKNINLGKILKPSTINIEFEETSSVKDVIENIDSSVEYYTIDGIKVDSSNIMKGLYIKKQGNKITKIVL